MVLIVTLNPSVDLLYFEENFSLAAHNRFQPSTMMAAGKGINCSRALSYLGIEATSLALVGGKTGKFFKELLKTERFHPVFLSIDDETRHSITIMHNNGVHTEIVETGPKVSSPKLRMEIFDTIVKLAKKEKPRIISLNGSVHSDDPYFYNNLIALLRQKLPAATKIFADFSKEALHLIVNDSFYKPDFIKPNMDEFSELIGQKLSDKQQVLDYLITNPIPVPYTLVSCGEQGAIAQFNGKLYDVTAPSIELINPTGSGDSTVAGAIYAFEHGMSDEMVIRYAIASGTANAMEQGVGIAKHELVSHLLDQVIIQPVS